MRVTQQMMADRTSQSIGDNLERLNALQSKAASGKRFEKTSDEPLSARAALGLRSHLQTTQAYLNASERTADWMSATESALGQMVDLATQAVTLTLKGVSDTGADGRPLLAQEVNQLLEQAIQVGNTTHAGSAVFAGYQVQLTQPFNLILGSPDTVSYNGDTGVIQRNLGPGQNVTVNVDGEAAFTPLFNALIEARDALNAGDVNSIQLSATHLQSAQEQVAEVRSVNGTRQRQVSAIADQLQEAHSTLASLLSQREDVNLAEAITDLRRQETVYQSALEVGNRTLATLNLFDLMR